MVFAVVGAHVYFWWLVEVPYWIIASFLPKNLGIYFMQGEKDFMYDEI